MKFLRVEVENWRPFRGKTAMDIAAIDEQPITLVFGKNGGGKTSLLTAIYWCLYGTTDLEEDKGDQNLVNDHAVSDLGATRDNPARATVTLYVSHSKAGNTFLYRIERAQRAYETSGTRTETSDGLIVDRIAPPQGFASGADVVAAWRHRRPADRFEDTEAQGVIESVLLAEGLAKYFFYPGETLSFPFKGDKKSRDQLQGFLREISGRSKFNPFADAIAEASKVLDAQSKAHADANERTQSLQAEIEQLKNELAEAERRLPAARSEREAADANRQAVDDQLSDLSTFKELLANSNTAREKLTAAKAAVELAEQSLSDALARAYLCVASPIFRAVVGIFERRQYPSDVSRTLVEQIRATNECICGRQLEPGMLERIEPLSPADSSVNGRMLSLRGHAARLTVSSSQEGAVDSATHALHEAIGVRSDASEALSAAEARVKSKGADHFEGVDEDNLIAARSECLSAIEALDLEIGGLGVTIDHLKKQIAAKSAEKRAAAPKTDKAIHRAAGIADEMGGLLDDIRQKQADVARGQLETLIEQNYVVFETNLYPSIDSDYRVGIYETKNNAKLRRQIGDLSGSQTALLTYAFAAAAAKLIPQYQTLDNLLTTVPEFSEVEPIPLVVDAPFTSLGPEYKRRVMDLMARGFSQVIMFTEAVDLEVLEGEANRIGEEYIVRYEGSLDSVENSFNWRGQTYIYAVSNSEETRSTLERIGTVG